MTNAIKFTRTESTREIKVKMAASLRPPSETEPTIEWVKRGRIGIPCADQTDKPEWGDGEIIYISITVTDTGRGLTEEELKNLFHLFAQASPKTHQTYGGSGLGLFISCQLVNMQGGEIGVQSKAGEGSTFTFYIKTRRTLPDAPELEEAERVSGVNSSGRPTVQRNRSMNNAEKVDARSFSLLVREDALREACAVEISALQNGGMMANLQPEHGTAGPVTSEAGSSYKELERTGERTEKEVKPATKKVWHILVVEDNLVNQKVVTKQLRKNGHVVSVANHGEEALEFIRRSEFWVDGGADDRSPTEQDQHLNLSLRQQNGNSQQDGDNQPNGDNQHSEESKQTSENKDKEIKKEKNGGEKLDVVLLDLEMPVMDGLTCVRRIRELQVEGKIADHIPVIAVTANARKDQIMTSYEAGMVSLFIFLLNFLTVEKLGRD